MLHIQGSSSSRPLHHAGGKAYGQALALLRVNSVKAEEALDISRQTPMRRTRCPRLDTIQIHRKQYCRYSLLQDSNIKTWLKKLVELYM
jgi:hypothetical protein